MRASGLRMCLHALLIYWFGDIKSWHWTGRRVGPISIRSLCAVIFVYTWLYLYLYSTVQEFVDLYFHVLCLYCRVGLLEPIRAKLRGIIRHCLFINQCPIVAQLPGVKINFKLPSAPLNLYEHWTNIHKLMTQGNANTSNFLEKIHFGYSVQINWGLEGKNTFLEEQLVW